MSKTKISTLFDKDQHLIYTFFKDVSVRYLCIEYQKRFGEV